MNPVTALWILICALAVVGAILVGLLYDYRRVRRAVVDAQQRICDLEEGMKYKADRKAPKQKSTREKLKQLTKQCTGVAIFGGIKHRCERTTRHPSGRCKSHRKTKDNGLGMELAEE